MPSWTEWLCELYFMLRDLNLSPVVSEIQKAVGIFEDS
jgi:hypothetical protein